MTSDSCLTRVAVVEAAVEAERVRVNEGFASRDKALDVASITLGDHLHQLNGFHGAMREQAARFITRDEHEILMAQITRIQIEAKAQAAEYITRRELDQTSVRLDLVEKTQANLQGRYAMIAIVFSAFVATAGLLIAWERSGSPDSQTVSNTAKIDTLLQAFKAHEVSGAATAKP